MGSANCAAQSKNNTSDHTESMDSAVLDARTKLENSTIVISISTQVLTRNDNTSNNEGDSTNNKEKHKNDTCSIQNIAESSKRNNVIQNAKSSKGTSDTVVYNKSTSKTITSTSNKDHKQDTSVTTSISDQLCNDVTTPGPRSSIGNQGPHQCGCEGPESCANPLGGVRDLKIERAKCKVNICEHPESFRGPEGNITGSQRDRDKCECDISEGLDHPQGNITCSQKDRDKSECDISKGLDHPTSVQLDKNNSGSRISDSLKNSTDPSVDCNPSQSDGVKSVQGNPHKMNVPRPKLKENQKYAR